MQGSGYLDLEDGRLYHTLQVHRGSSYPAGMEYSELVVPVSNVNATEMGTVGIR